jgi:hypothetical protein
MRKITITKYVLTVIGLGLLILTVVIFNNQRQFIETSIISTGEVVDLLEGQGVVEFTTPDGETYKFTSKFGSSNPSYRIGDKVEVLYGPASPNEAEINSFWSLWFLVVLVGSLGLITLSIGGGIIWHGRSKTYLIERLKKFGLPIETQFQKVELNEGIAINGKHPYRIISQCVKDGELYVFHSENIWSDISNEVMVDKITVWVDPDNMKKYYMDISFLSSQKKP